jgi:perosamine synthetase
MYSKKVLDFDKYLERNRCPENNLLCEEAVWISHNMLLGSKSDMGDIAAAIEKIHKSAGELKEAARK